MARLFMEFFHVASSSRTSGLQGRVVYNHRSKHKGGVHEMLFQRLFTLFLQSCSNPLDRRDSMRDLVIDFVYGQILSLDHPRPLAQRSNSREHPHLHCISDEFINEK